MSVPADRAAPLYELFWENSKLDRFAVREFRERVAAHVPPPGPPALQFPAADAPLPRPRDRLARALRRRASARDFGTRQLSPRQLGGLLEAVACSEGRRAFPSAGGTYALDVFCLLERVSGALGRCVAYYNADTHGLSRVRELPPWDEYRGLVNLEPSTGVPAVVVVLVAFAGRTTARYGERGGRFVLLEAGHAAQNLSLRAAHHRLAGCEAGGLFDDGMKALLGLAGTDAHVVLGYACGPTP